MAIPIGFVILIYAIVLSHLYLFENNLMGYNHSKLMQHCVLFYWKFLSRDTNAASTDIFLYILGQRNNNYFGFARLRSFYRHHGETYKEMCFISIVWYVREDIRFWSFMSSDCVGELHFINGIMNAEDYVKILNENMSRSFKRLGKKTYVPAR